MQIDDFFARVEQKQLGSSDLPEYDGRPLPSATKNTCGGQQSLVEGHGYEPHRVVLDQRILSIFDE